MGEKHWYAVYTRVNCEVKLAGILKKKGIKVLYPYIEKQHFWSDRKKNIKKPLFPSYIFVYINTNEYYSVTSSAGFSHFICFQGKPATIPDTQIDAINKLLLSRYAWWVESRVLKKGTKVEVTEGTLAGQQGVLVRDSDQKNIAIEITALSQSIIFSLNPHQFKVID
ncbi:transcription termination/antitermination NusG family protein [Zooshikella marina]|uniref:UpxY family transcription antiterminator n=1 Tax=Zooshikella ganghwensis TaxID=202772 RepID=UPI001BAEE527|nr:UpxY family transcription antiterminator [Zooshikella ganghwensis]MBU2705425.1 transcription termination/antitermination NusG family protein [Zooshikella ganghwensis]